jgi:type I restriction enzyme S subunit
MTWTQDFNLSDSFKETEIGPIPVDWDVVRLGDVASLTMGQSPPSSTYNIDGAGLPFLQGKAEFGEAYPTPVKWCSRPQKVTDRGSVLISVRAPVGDVNVARDDYCIGRGLAAINGSESLDNWFLFYLLIFAKRRLEERGTGSTFKSINKGVLQNFSIPLPPLPEQRRIAHVLSTIQRAIAAQDDLIAAAREVKRSLMQRLFTYGPGPEPAPTKETEIGEMPEHWEVVRLGDVLQTTQYGLSVRADRTGKYPMLRMNNLDDGRIDALDLKYVDLDEGDFAKFRVRKRDVLFNRTNSYELVGKTAIFDTEGDFVFASYLIRVVPDAANLLPESLNYYLNWDDAQRRLKMLATRGVSQSNISATKLKRFVIGLPSITEQEEIAHSLSAADCKIEAEEQRKAALQALFKAMLHQLMTGQIRLRATETYEVWETS